MAAFSDRPPASGPPEFRALLEEHRELDARLLRHQTLLVEGSSAAAETALHELRGHLAGHLEGEERIVLPFYGKNVEAPKGGGVNAFQGEHLKLTRLLQEAAAWMEAWRGLDWPPAEVVFLIEREKVFKEVMEHHDEREHHFLYPLIEDVTDAPARQALVERFRVVALEEERRWKRTPAGSRPGVRPPRSDSPAPARVGARTCLTLIPLYEALVAGAEHERAPAPWGEGLETLRSCREELLDTSEAAHARKHFRTVEHLLTEVTPLKRFPVSRSAEVLSAFHLLRACGRAAGAAHERKDPA